MNARLFTFRAGDAGQWRILETRSVRGPSLAGAARLAVEEGAGTRGGPAGWSLRGIVSNERYVTRGEHDELGALESPLARPAATHAVRIPVRKHDAWWELTPDERRAILGERSRHVARGMRSLPAVARRLLHCRDLGEHEPFDFLTWFEFAPADVAIFDDLLGELRGTEEWTFVSREVEVRLAREGA